MCYDDLSAILIPIINSLLSCLVQNMYLRSLFHVTSSPGKTNTAKHLRLSNICHTIPGGGGVLPYMGYIGMCGPEGYGFSAVWVINRVSILADFSHFGHK